jgi:hypothetical protein
MEEKIGLVKGIECKFVKTEPALIDALAQKTGVDVEKIKVILRYNVFTINQFALLTGLSVSHILNKTRPSVINGKPDTELNFCYPFLDEEGDGPKFIFRDEKAERLLK